MKFATAKEHRDFFQKKGWIEFEGLISDDQLSQINQAIDNTLAERLQISANQLRLLSSEQLYLQGRDLWRANDTLHKLATQVRFAELVAELIEKKPLRLGYDQFFAAHPQSQNWQTPAYSNFLKQPASLEEVSCLKGVVCGLVLALGGKQDSASIEAPAEGIDVFPKHPGNVLFFQPQIPIKWESLTAHSGQRFYMIVYTQASAHYYLQPQDPHTHALKRLGYIFNDKLNEKLHPFIYR